MACGAAVLIGAGHAAAGTIAIDNFSFESPGVYTNGANINSVNNERFTVVDPPAWKLIMNGAGPFFADGVADPSASLYSGTGANSIQGALPGTGHGFAYGYMNVQHGKTSILEYVGTSLGSIAASTSYTLTIAIGQRKDDKAPLYTLQMLDGVNVVASASALGVTDTFGDLTVNYMSTTSGGPLGIRIMASNSFADDRQANFDNVRLTATTVPAPATAALLLAPLAGMARRSRRTCPSIW